MNISYDLKFLFIFCFSAFSPYLGRQGFKSVFPGIQAEPGTEAFFDQEEMDLPDFSELEKSISKTPSPGRPDYLDIGSGILTESPLELVSPTSHISPQMVQSYREKITDADQFGLPLIQTYQAAPPGRVPSPSARIPSPAVRGSSPTARAPSPAARGPSPTTDQPSQKIHKGEHTLTSAEQYFINEFDDPAQRALLSRVMGIIADVEGEPIPFSPQKSFTVPSLENQLDIIDLKEEQLPEDFDIELPRTPTQIAQEQYEMLYQSPHGQPTAYSQIPKPKLSPTYAGDEDMDEFLAMEAALKTPPPETIKEPQIFSPGILDDSAFQLPESSTSTAPPLSPFLFSSPGDIDFLDQENLPTLPSPGMIQRPVPRVTQPRSPISPPIDAEAFARQIIQDPYIPPYLRRNEMDVYTGGKRMVIQVPRKSPAPKLYTISEPPDNYSEDLMPFRSRVESQVPYYPNVIFPRRQAQPGLSPIRETEEDFSQFNLHSPVTRYPPSKIERVESPRPGMRRYKKTVQRRVPRRIDFAQPDPDSPVTQMIMESTARDLPSLGDTYPPELFGVSAPVQYEEPISLLDGTPPRELPSPLAAAANVPGWSTPEHLKVKAKTPPPFEFKLIPELRDIMSLEEAPEMFVLPDEEREYIPLSTDLPGFKEDFLTPSRMPTRRDLELSSPPLISSPPRRSPKKSPHRLRAIDEELEEFLKMEKLANVSPVRQREPTASASSPQRQPSSAEIEATNQYSQLVDDELSEFEELEKLYGAGPSYSGEEISSPGRAAYMTPPKPTKSPPEGSVWRTIGQDLTLEAAPQTLMPSGSPPSPFSQQEAITKLYRSLAKKRDMPKRKPVRLKGRVLERKSRPPRLPTVGEMPQESPDEYEYWPGRYIPPPPVIPRPPMVQSPRALMPPIYATRAPPSATLPVADSFQLPSPLRTQFQAARTPPGQDPYYTPTRKPTSRTERSRAIRQKKGRKLDFSEEVEELSTIERIERRADRRAQDIPMPELDLQPGPSTRVPIELHSPDWSPGLMSFATTSPALDFEVAPNLQTPESPKTPVKSPKSYNLEEIYGDSPLEDVLPPMSMIDYASPDRLSPQQRQLIQESPTLTSPELFQKRVREHEFIERSRKKSENLRKKLGSRKPRLTTTLEFREPPERRPPRYVREGQFFQITPPSTPEKKMTAALSAADEQYAMLFDSSPPTHPQHQRALDRIADIQYDENYPILSTGISSENRYLPPGLLDPGLDFHSPPPVSPFKGESMLQELEEIVEEEEQILTTSPASEMLDRYQGLDEAEEWEVAPPLAMSPEASPTRYDYGPETVPSPMISYTPEPQYTLDMIYGPEHGRSTPSPIASSPIRYDYGPETVPSPMLSYTPPPPSPIDLPSFKTNIKQHRLTSDYYKRKAKNRQVRSGPRYVPMMPRQLPPNLSAISEAAEEGYVSPPRSPVAGMSYQPGDIIEEIEETIVEELEDGGPWSPDEEFPYEISEPFEGRSSPGHLDTSPIGPRLARHYTEEEMKKFKFME